MDLIIFVGNINVNQNHNVYGYDYNLGQIVKRMCFSQYTHVGRGLMGSSEVPAHVSYPSHVLRGSTSAN